MLPPIDTGNHIARQHELRLLFTSCFLTILNHMVNFHDPAVEEKNYRAHDSFRV